MTCIAVLMAGCVVENDDDDEGIPHPVPPEARIDHLCEGLSCSFDGGDSIPGEEDNGIDHYEWEFGDGNQGEGRSVEWTYGQEGRYTVTLTVTGSRSDTTQVQVSVEGEPDQVPAPEVLWRSEMDSGTDHGMLIGAPVLKDGVAYLAANGIVYAFNMTDGSIAWTSGMDESDVPANALTVEDDVVYVTGGDWMESQVHPIFDGSVWAIDAADGSLLWQNTGYDELTEPTVSDGVLYTNGPHSVYALDAQDGSPVWSTRVMRMASVPPSVHDGVVYVGDRDSNVFALDATDGSELWKQSIGSYLQGSPPIVLSDLAYFGGWDGIYVLDPDDGSEKWHFETDQGGTVSFVVVDGAVYLGSRGQVQALDAQDGAEIWRFDTSTEWADPAPVMVDGSVYINSDHQVLAIDAKNGSTEWRFEVDEGDRVSPVAAQDGVVIFADWDAAYALAADRSE